MRTNLVDDSGAWLPETNVVLGARGAQEVVHLLVDRVCSFKILLATNLGLDKMVAVDGRGSCNAWHAGAHELQDSHLSRGVLASNSVRAELEVALATLDLLSMRVVQMRVEDLLGVCERAIEAFPHDVEVLVHLGIVDVMTLLPVGHLDLLGESGVIDGSEVATAKQPWLEHLIVSISGGKHVADGAVELSGETYQLPRSRS